MFDNCSFLVSLPDGVVPQIRTPASLSWSPHWHAPILPLGRNPFRFPDGCVFSHQFVSEKHAAAPTGKAAFWEGADMKVKSVTKFGLGELLVSKEVLLAISAREIADAIARHFRGDWGDLSKEDRDENELALEKGFRLFSVYHGSDGKKFWVITEADRSATTVLLPDEY
jgi:hypothetical protein